MGNYSLPIPPAQAQRVYVCLKNWGILSQDYCHEILRHGEVFRTCAVLTRLAIDDGEKLFEVE